MNLKGSFIMDEKFFDYLSDKVLQAFVILEQIKAIADMSDSYYTYTETDSGNVPTSVIFSTISLLTSKLRDELTDIDMSVFNTKNLPDVSIVPVAE